jgi:DNA-directed RNA polymerase I subunit RPA1
MDEKVSSLKSGDVCFRVDRVDFGFYTADQVRRLSVQQVATAVAFDDLGRPVRGGLYDPSLGAFDKRDLCATCKLGFFACPGHCGHIELAQPIVQPLLFSVLVRLLRSICFGCASFRLSLDREKIWISYIKRLEVGLWREAACISDFLLLGRQRRAADLPAVSYQTSDVSSEDGEGPSKASKDTGDQWEPEAKPAIGHDARWETLSVAQRKRRCFQFLQRFIGECAGSSSACTRCGTKAMRIRNDGCRIFVTLPVKKKRSRTAEVASKSKDVEFDQVSQETSILDTLKLVPGREQLLLPSMIEHILNEVKRNSKELCAYLFQNQIAESFLLHVLLVPPSRFRLPSTREDNEGNVPREHAQNFHYMRVLKANERVKQAMSMREPLALGRAVIELQQSVQSLMDSESDVAMRRAPGIRQQLEHKEGIFRMHLMGKRVNYSARSVISPDPFLDVNEVGIPRQFAMKLSFPELVANWNLTQLQDAVRNGPQHYPGANLLEKGNGLRIQIQAGNAKQSQVLAETLFEREELPDGAAIPHRVFRHLRNGDRVLFNRQPTLHRVGLMAHRVRVLGPTESTLRLHYANCSAYNADFDGDEMNLHVPQDLVAAAEAEYLLRVDHHYVTPTSGAPVRGLIQDHVLGAVLMTLRDCFFSWEEFSSFIYSATIRLWERANGRNKTEQRVELGPRAICARVVPAIMHPQQLWTGKQVISTVLRVLMHLADPEHRCKSLSMTSRAKVGPAFWGQHAAEESTVIIRDGELVQGVLDKAQVGASPFGLVHCVHEWLGPEAAADLLSVFSRLFTLFLRQHGHTTGVDDLLLQPFAEQLRLEIMGKARDSLGPQILRQVLQHPQAATDDLERALAASLCSERARQVETRLDLEMKKELAALGSQVLEVCIPHGLYKPFPRNGFALMTSSGAKGSQVNAAQISCLLGSTVLDGRRVPRTVVGWTLPSFRPYDAGAEAGGFIPSRFLTGLNPQEYFFHCMAGREGLTDTAVKTARSGYLQRCLVKALESVSVMYDGSVRDSDGSIIQFLYGEDGLDPCQALWIQKQLDWVRSMCLKSPTDCSAGGAALANESLVHGRRSRSVGVAQMKVSKPAGLTAETSLRFQESIQAYEAPERDALIQFYQRAAATPGDAVGILAAQSIGEPSTQMTLNTFHFAGIGIEHVTVGVPRLRELLMFPGSPPATPFMQIPFKRDVSRESATEICNALRSVRLRDLILKLHIRLDIEKQGAGAYLTLRVHLVEPELYGKMLGLPRISAEERIAKAFGRHLKALILRRVRALENQGTVPLKSKASGAAASPPDPDPTDTAETSAPLEETIDAGFSDTSSESSSESESVEETESTSELDTQGATDDASDSDAALASEKKASENPSAWNADLGDTNEPGTLELLRRSDDLDSVQVRFLSEIELETCLWIQSPLWYAVFVDELALLAAERVFLRSVAGVRNSALVTNEESGTLLRIEGSNIPLAWTLPPDKLDLDRLHGNNISQILEVYGVEAAQRLVVHELQTVFAAYGIPVDYRHICLIADYQTALGGCRPFTRTGMRILDSAPSPLQRMSFESATQFLRDAALAREEDRLESASAKLCLGQPVSFGTGSFSLLLSLTDIEKETQ